jgi:hypothetical protein
MLFASTSLAGRIERAECRLENAQRRGFDLLYSRAILIKEP